MDSLRVFRYVMSTATHCIILHCKYYWTTICIQQKEIRLQLGVSLMVSAVLKILLDKSLYTVEKLHTENERN